jgi:transposase InsO family protein
MSVYRCNARGRVGRLRQALRSQDADHGARSPQRPRDPLLRQPRVKLLRMLTDRGSEYCGNPEPHEYELYLAIEDIDHSRTKTKSPQTNGICERFHKTVLNEFYRVAFRGIREYDEEKAASGTLVLPANRRCKPCLTQCP